MVFHKQVSLTCWSSHLLFEHSLSFRIVHLVYIHLYPINHSSAQMMFHLFLVLFSPLYIDSLIPSPQVFQTCLPAPRTQAMRPAGPPNTQSLTSHQLISFIMNPFSLLSLFSLNFHFSKVTEAQTSQVSFYNFQGTTVIQGCTSYRNKTNSNCDTSTSLTSLERPILKQCC